MNAVDLSRATLRVVGLTGFAHSIDLGDGLSRDFSTAATMEIHSATVLRIKWEAPSNLFQTSLGGNVYYELIEWE